MRHALALTVLMASGFTIAPAADQPPGDGKEKLPELLNLKPMEAKPGDDPMRKLMIARYNESLAEVRCHFHQNTMGFCGSAAPTLLTVSNDTTRLVESRLPLCENAAERIALLTQAVAYQRYIEERMVVRELAGLLRMSDVHLARYLRIDAEIRLLREKQSETKIK